MCDVCVCVCVCACICVCAQVLWVIRRPERWLACAAIRFIRTCLGTKDNFYTRQLVKGNLLDPVMSAFFQNGDRYNLLNSAVIELVDFAIAGGLKEVVEHLVEQFGSRLDEIDYVDTFKKLRVRYEQHKDAEAEQQQQGAGKGHTHAHTHTHTHTHASHTHTHARACASAVVTIVCVFLSESVSRDAASFHTVVWFHVCVHGLVPCVCAYRSARPC